MRRALFLLMLVSLFSLAPMARAQDAAALDPMGFIVKTISARQHADARKNGSGVLVQHLGAVYVLTSEHVTFHDNETSVHQFHLDGQKPQPMTFITADWAVGLALLRAPGVKPSVDIPQLESLAGVKSAIGDAAMSIGFPSASDSVTADVDGKVSAVDHVTEILVDVDRMLEITGAHSEFGMSGGAVINDAGLVSGILSHEGEGAGPTGKTLYAIPIGAAARWALRVATEPDFKPYLFRTNEDFDKPQYQFVHSGQLQFSTTHDPYFYKWDAIAMEGFPESSPSKLLPGRFFEKVIEHMKMFLKPGTIVGYHPRVSVTAFHSVSFMKAGETRESVGSMVSFFRRMMRDSTVRPEGGYNYAGSPGGYDWCVGAEKLMSNVSAWIQTQLLQDAISKVRSAVDSYEDHDLGTRCEMPQQYMNKDDVDWVLNAPELQKEWKQLKYDSPQDYQKLRDALEKVALEVDAVSI